jgi:hypothetical protein
MKRLLFLAVILLGLMAAPTSCVDEEAITPTSGAGGTAMDPK